MWKLNYRNSEECTIHAARWWREEGVDNSSEFPRTGCLLVDQTPTIKDKIWINVTDGFGLAHSSYAAYSTCMLKTPQQAPRCRRVRLSLDIMAVAVCSAIEFLEWKSDMRIFTHLSDTCIVSIFPWD